MKLHTSVLALVGVYSGWGQNDTVRSDGCGYSSSLTNL